MTEQELDEIEEKLKEMPVGGVRILKMDGHNILFVRTRLDGLHSGCSRYTVACETCEKLIHTASTGPLPQAKHHLLKATEVVL